jgi:hypothetical protein
MATVKDAIGKYIIGILDGNSENQVFNVAIDIKTDAERLQYFQENIINPNTRDIIEYTPCALNFEGTPAGIKDIDKTTWNIELEFGFTGLDDDDEDFLSQKAAVEELRLELDTSKFTVVANNEFYHCKARATSISRSGEIRPLAGYKRILMSMGITIVSGIGIRFGDDEVWELQNLNALNAYEYTVLNVITKQFNETPTFKPKHTYDESHANNIPETATYLGEFEIVFQEELLMHQDLYDRGKGKVSDNTPQPITTVYDLRITKPYAPTGDKLTYQVYLQITNQANESESIKLKGTMYNA